MKHYIDPRDEGPCENCGGHGFGSVPVIVGLDELSERDVQCGHCAGTGRRAGKREPKLETGSFDSDGTPYYRWRTRDMAGRYEWRGPYQSEASAVLAARCSVLGLDVTRCMAGRDLYWIATLHVDEGTVKRKLLPGHHATVDAAICAAIDARKAQR
jgi:hypothetical protein